MIFPVLGFLKIINYAYLTPERRTLTSLYPFTIIKYDPAQFVTNTKNNIHLEQMYVFLYMTFSIHLILIKLTLKSYCI